MKMLREIAAQSDELAIQEAAAEGVIEIDPINYAALLDQLIDEDVIRRVREETL